VICHWLYQLTLLFVQVSDIYDTETHSCHDGTAGCPIVGTLGSWAFYILGIFMACVFLLGPKTAFGQSEQNPSYWLILLLSAKKTGSKCTYYDPVSDQTKTRILRPNDWRLFIRFVMSFLINGVGFHILVHALPIQVAGQSSLTGVVFRAVGMMYLVDLDDTPGYTLTLVEEDKDDKRENTDAAAQPTQLSEGEIATKAQMIIEDARGQLDALATGFAGGNVTGKKKMGAAGMLAIAGGVGATAAMANLDNVDVEVEGGDGEGDAAGEEGGDAGGEEA
jgi:hypothetical protein